MGMWLFLFTELLLFGGLFLVYLIYRYTHGRQTPKRSVATVDPEIQPSP